MRLFAPLIFTLVSSAALFSACTVGDPGDFGDGDGDGDAGGAGGGSGGSNLGGETASGGTTSVVKFFQAPEGFPVTLPEVVRTDGYSSDSAGLRLRDAYRAVNKQIYPWLETCGVATDGSDYHLDYDTSYSGLCHRACLTDDSIRNCTEAENIICEWDDGTFQDATVGMDMQTCFDSCEEFQCDDGQNMSNVRCDAIIDCADASDEKNCGDLSMLCADGTEAVKGLGVCDGVPDCSDGSDELNCGTEGFVCGDGTRIQAAWECDGTEDCADGSDETSESCDFLRFPCGGSEFIAWYQVCDGMEDCSNGDDEDYQCASRDVSMCTP